MRNTSLLAAPAEPVIENDLPLDLSCNSRRRSEDDEEEEEDDGQFHSPGRRSDGLMNAKEADLHHCIGERSSSLVVSLAGPPSPPRSPASDFRALSDLGYVAYHRQLMAMERQRQWLLEHHQAADVAAAQQDVMTAELEETDGLTGKDRDRSRRHYRMQHRFQRQHRRNKNNEIEAEADDNNNDEEEQEPVDGQHCRDGHDLLIMRRQRRRRSLLGYDDEEDDDDEEDEECCLGSDAEEDSDDSHQNPMDLGLANPKAYKKSLMKRYRKFKQQNTQTQMSLFLLFLGHTFPSSYPFPFCFKESPPDFFLVGCSLWRSCGYRVGTHFAIVWS